MRTNRLVLALSCLSLLVSCASDTEAVDKEEAARLNGGADLGRDFCEEFEWYGDGICDTFCQRADTMDCGSIRNIDGEGPTVCVGVRGNGQLITAHFASLARIIEHYGLISGVAGGSSGSITSFFLESIEMNPAVRCDSCTPEEQAARAALLFKSFQGYFGVLATSDEALAFQQVGAVYAQVQMAGVESLLESDPTMGVSALQTILESPDVQALINPEVVQLLATSPDPEYHARDIVDSLANAADFNADSPLILVRPGVLNFEALAARLGRVGSFYAGYAPTDAAAMETWLSDCATPSRGMTWGEAAALSSSGGTCGEAFGALVTDFRAEITANESMYASRIDDPIGGEIHALISTSVLEGGAVDEWNAARQSYLNAEGFDFNVDFNEVKFGYWGAADDLNTVEENIYRFNDAKTARFTSLGSPAWREALAFSPAEPGLARALELPDGRVSAGGWSDLHPTLVLRNMGCDQVIYVTRRGQESGFAMGVAGLLGMDADQSSALYDLSSRSSAYSISVAEAEGVWCTDWNNQSATDLVGVEADAYNAPFEVRDARLMDAGYENTTNRAGFAGCSVGVTE